MAEDIKRVENETPRTSDIKADFPYDACEFDDVNKVTKPKILMKGFSWKLDNAEIETTDGAEDGLLYLNGPLIAMSGASAFPTSDPGITGKIWSSSNNLVLSGYIPPNEPLPPILILASKSIASTNQVTDLSVYEDGGTSELPDGALIKISVTGGLVAGTYNMLWTGTTYTIDGVALSTDDRRLVGESYLILEKDGTNSNWVIVEDGREKVYAYYTNNAAGSNASPINFQTKQFDKYLAVTTGASWKFTAPKSKPYTISTVIQGTGGSTTLTIYKGGNSYQVQGLLQTVFQSYSFTIFLNKGEYVDIRPSTGSILSAQASGCITIVEN